jgi:hypothetical protein
MDKSEFSFDLFELVRIGLRWKKHIIGFAILMSVCAIIFFLTKKNEYKAYGSYYPSSPFSNARINVFNENNPQWVDIFGAENEVDRTYIIGTSENCIGYLIRKFELAKHYDIDTNEPNAMLKVYKIFSKKYSLKRTGFNHLEVSFEDENQVLAGKIVNESMVRTEDLLREFYATSNNQIVQGMLTRADSLSSELYLFTDSLSKMRVKYGIYDLLNPERNNMIVSTPKGRGLQFAEGLEKIQNVEIIKDRLAMDVSKYKSIANQFKTIAESKVPLLLIMQKASNSSPKSGPYRMLGVALTAVFSALFALLLATSIEVFQRTKLQF